MGHEGPCPLGGEAEGVDEQKAEPPQHILLHQAGNHAVGGFFHPTVNAVSGIGVGQEEGMEFGGVVFGESAEVIGGGGEALLIRPQGICLCKLSLGSGKGGMKCG